MDSWKRLNCPSLSDKKVFYSNLIHCLKSVRVLIYSGPHFSRIFSYSNWIWRDTCIQSECGKCGKNVGQKNSEYRHFLRSDNGKYYRCWLLTSKKSLGRFQNTKSRRVSWFIREKWYTAIGWCIQKLPQQVHRNVRAWSITNRQISVTGRSKKVRSKIRTADWYHFSTNERERGIRCVVCHAIHQHAKLNNKCMKDYGANNESSCFMYWYVNSLYGEEMQQNLPIDCFEWIKNLFRFNEEFQ